MTKGQRQLLAEIRTLAVRRGLVLRVAKARGKGSHMRVYVGERHTTVPTKVKPDLRRAILKQLQLVE
jgi:hypothetical protein